MTIEEFNIAVKLESSKALKNLQALKEAMKGFKEGIKEGFEEAQDSMDEMANSEEEVAKEAVKEQKTFKKNNDAKMKALTKLAAKLAILKKVIDIVGQAFKKGFNNAYNFSKLTGGDFAKAMDKLTSKWTVFSNAGGALGSQLLETIEPLLSYILDIVIRVTNGLNEALAKLRGQSTYLKANVDYQTEYNKEVKKSKQLISGLDELNVYQRNDIQDSKNMFTEANVTATKYDGIIDKISGFFDKVKSWYNEKFKPWFDDMWGKVKPFFEEIFSNTGGIIDGLWDAIFGGEGLDPHGTIKKLFVGFAELGAEISQFINNVVNSDGFKTFVGWLKDILGLVAGVGATFLGFLTDLFKVANGEMTFRELWSNLQQRFVDNILGPWKEVWGQLKIWWYKLMDDMDVGIYNVLHPNNKIEHGNYYGAYEQAYYELNGHYTSDYQSMLDAERARVAAQNNTFANSIKNTQVKLQSGQLVKMTSADAQLYNMMHNIGKSDADIKSAVMASANINASTFRERFGYANGGIFTSPTFGLLGEYSGARNNPEIATPKSLLDETIASNNTTLISAWAQIAQQIIRAVENVDMSVSIGDSVIAQSANRGQDQYYKLTGKALIN